MRVCRMFTIQVGLIWEVGYTIFKINTYIPFSKSLIFHQKSTFNKRINCTLHSLSSYFVFCSTEVGIYKRKQESKKTRKKEFDQENDQEKKKTRKKKLDQESDQEIDQEKTFFFS